MHSCRLHRPRTGGPAARPFVLGLLLLATAASAGSAPAPLRVSEDRRFLVTADGQPFFWLGDTAWELFHRLNREEADLYLRDRAAKGFTVIQAVALAELDGLNTPNAYGHRPLLDHDPARPDVKEGPENDYWDHVDDIVARAAALGLRLGFLPTWGDKWHKQGGTGPQVFNPQNARIYGRFLGERYRHQPIVWILGGDKFVGDDEERRTLEAMAQGLKEGDQGRHLLTFHPIGQYSSALWFHDAPWLDFNMIQTGHTRDRDNHTSIAAEYGRVPVKPVLDGEPGYENIPHGFNLAHGRLEAIHARRSCYWALFSGAFGHTYGCNEVWQMWAPGRNPLIGAERPWHEAIHLPGASQMQHARRLIESGPYFDRLPDPSLVAPPNTTGTDYVAACRAPDARYALVYFPSGQPATLRTFLLQGPRLAARWFDPRTGEHRELPAVEVAPWKTTTFHPPAADQDWVLVLQQPAPPPAGDASAAAGSATDRADGRLPLLYSTDLFHPHDDPDDHFDLAALYAIPEFDLRGIVLDQGQIQVSRPGKIPVAQLNALTSRHIPAAVGLASKLGSPTDAAWQQPEPFQGGVRLILDTLRAADRRVDIITVGSVRDVTAAFNREPALFRERAGRILMFIGEASEPGFREHNVNLDPHAFVGLMRSGLDLYWVPCFDGGLWRNGGRASFWQATHADLLHAAPPELVQYFLYALNHETSDPLRYLRQPVDPSQRDRWFPHTRNLWCTAVFRALTRPGNPDGDAFTFETVAVAVGDDAVVRPPPDEPGQKVHRFQMRDAGRYRAEMTAETARILAGFPVAQRSEND